MTSHSGKVVGILGGGQLGRMLSQATHPLGLKSAVLDPMGEDSPSGHVANIAVKGDFKDAQQILQFVEKVKPDVLTVEIEHVNVEALISVQQKHQISIQPSPETIRIIQDKFFQKQHLKAHGVALPDFREANNKEDILAIGKEFGYPIMLKSRKLAYDGRGNTVVKTAEEIEGALKSLVSSEVYVEKWVYFEKEIAVMVTRGLDGKIVSYPVVETIQKNNMCDTVIAPAQIPAHSCALATKISEQAISSLPGAGIYGVELFLLKDGQVLLNEIAPRVHNSGHYTIEACHTSQFEQHIRAILGLPLGSPLLQVGGAVMINVIGNGNMEETFRPCIDALSVPGASVHWYCKTEAKAARKMGHITIVGTSVQQALDLASKINKGDKILSSIVPQPIVGVIMGSDSDLPVMKTVATILRDFGVPFELTIVSAHRTPQRMMDYARDAHKRGLRIIIAAAGGAAHLPGMVAAITPLPVIGVPIALKVLDGQDSLYSIVQMPRGVPVATVAINNSTNAALLAIRMLGQEYLQKMIDYQKKMEEQVLQKVDVLQKEGWEKYVVHSE